MNTKSACEGHSHELGAGCADCRDAAASRPETTAGSLTPEQVIEMSWRNFHQPDYRKHLSANEWFLPVLQAMQESGIKFAAARASSGTRPDKVTEMFLCEINRLVLHSHQTYIFRSHPDCYECSKYLGLGLESVAAPTALAAATPAVTGEPMSPRKMAHLNTIWEPWTDSEGKPLVCGICKQEIPQCEQGYHGDGKQVFHECCSYQQQIAELKLAAAVPADEGLREIISEMEHTEDSCDRPCYNPPPNGGKIDHEYCGHSSSYCYRCRLAAALAVRRETK